MRPGGSTSRYNVITDQTYDHRGLTASESTTCGGQTYTASYGYDSRGRRNEMGPITGGQ